MELTIEHLAAYLPYGLKVKTDSLGIFKVNGSRKIPSGKISILTNDTHIGFLQEIQLVLRPLSDLSKEIEHNGQKFVPIEILKEIFNCNIEDFDIDEKLNLNVFNRFEYFNIAFTDILEMIEKLHSWLFDTQGLIEAGLAVNYNEINK